MQNFLHFATFLALCTKTCWVFTGCSFFWCKISYSFDPTAPKKVFGFSQDFPSSDAKFHHSTFLASLYQELLGFHRIFLFWWKFFTCFSTFLALLHLESFNSHNDFLFWCKIPKCANNHTTMVPAEYVRSYRYSDLKQFLSVKFFTFLKLNPPEFFHENYFLHIQKLQPKTKLMYVTVLAGMVRSANVSILVCLASSKPRLGNSSRESLFQKSERTPRKTGTTLLEAGQQTEGCWVSFPQLCWPHHVCLGFQIVVVLRTDHLSPAQGITAKATARSTWPTNFQSHKHVLFEVRCAHQQWSKASRQAVSRRKADNEKYWTTIFTLPHALNNLTHIPKFSSLLLHGPLCRSNLLGDICRQVVQVTPKFVRYFSAISQFSEILGKSPKKLVRIRPRKHSYCRKQGVLFFGFRPKSSVFVRFWKIEKNDFLIFSSHFLEIHFSWISTESDVLWCIGGPQPTAKASWQLLSRQPAPVEHPPPQLQPLRFLQCPLTYLHLVLALDRLLCTARLFIWQGPPLVWQLQSQTAETPRNYHGFPSLWQEVARSREQVSPEHGGAAFDGARIVPFIACNSQEISQERQDQRRPRHRTTKMLHRLALVSCLPTKCSLFLDKPQAD